MMYIKATVKQITSNPNLKVKLEGVEKFILKYKDYEEEIKSVNGKFEDENIFVDDNQTNNLKLEYADKEFSVQPGIVDLIKNSFTSGTAYVFEIDPSDTITSVIRKCD